MPLAIADSSNVWAVPRLCSMNAAPKPRPRMETSASVRPSFRRSTGPGLALADGEAAREIKPAMAPPKRVRRMKSRRELPAFIFENSLWRNPVSTEGDAKTRDGKRSHGKQVSSVAGDCPGREAH